VSLSKRLWDVARANVHDFTSAFRDRDDRLTAEERAKIEAEVEAEERARRSVGSRAGRRARTMRDRAEEAWEAAFEAAQARAEQGGYHSGRPSASDILSWYRTPEVEPGADYQTVRRAYRKLLAKYHPDRYENEPEKHRAATEVAQKITTAYNGLKEHLDPG
jgi:DnaJ-domain-containing protein 1